MNDDVQTSISIDSHSRNTNALSIVNSNDTSPPPPIPYVGHIFPDLESGRQFYYCYAGYAAFDVRRYFSKLIDSVIQSKKFVCSKQGESMKKMDTDLVECHKISRKSHNVRESCKAQITFKIDTGSTNWRVHIFLEHHTHELVTSKKRRFLRVNRHMSSTSRGLLLDSLNSAHIQPSQQYSYTAMASGGFFNLSYTQNDFYNYRRDGRISACPKDVDLVLDKFENLKSLNPLFFYSIAKDDKGRFPMHSGLQTVW